MSQTISAQALEKINKFSRKELSADEIYVFSVILCDNEIDRDSERFSIQALKKLSELFVGKTGIFDHNPKGSNQTARIFETELINDLSKETTAGEAYSCLKATAYMVRTPSNEDLIREIDGGIKKEVSVSCSVAMQICSICNANRSEKACSHKKGKLYGGKSCYITLDEPTDAYEWSFVAVPAQKNAGVTKRFGNSETDGDSVVIAKSEYDFLKNSAEEFIMNNEKIRDELKSEIVKLSFLFHPEVSVKTLLRLAEGMTLDELFDMKKELAQCSLKCNSSQLFKSNEITQSVSEFRMNK